MNYPIEFFNQIEWKNLHIKVEDIYLSMGKGYQPDHEMEKQLEKLFKEIFSRCNPSFLYALFNAGDSQKNHINADGTELHTGSIITPYLNDAKQYAIFVATAGTEFEIYQHEVKNSGDIYKEFLVDAIGSAIAESVVKYICEIVENRVKEMGWGISFPYSPGYCGWHVSQQQILFSLLPPSPCGVTLHPSSLMTPIKSVSGIIAVGPNVTKKKYGCEICKKKDCYKNRNKI